MAKTKRNGPMRASGPWLATAARALAVAMVTAMAAPWVTPASHAAEERAVASTINHAFATELGTGFYDLGGSSVFVVRITPAKELRGGSGPTSPGIRLVAPITVGSLDFNPVDAIGEVELPSRIDTFTLMPGVEFDFALKGGWLLTPWVRAGLSFAGNSSDGWLYGAGARLNNHDDSGKVEVTRRMELALVTVDYRSAQPSDTFVRLRNAIDARRPTLPLGKDHRLLAGLYGIVDIVPDPPRAPADAGKQSVVQLEAGITLNTDPRLQLGWLRWPRLGFGYRYAGDFSGWRIVVGAPF